MFKKDKKIYELPLIEAFENKNSECPFCDIEAKVETSVIESMFAEQIADSEFYTDLGVKYSFCKTHLNIIYAMPNKLGLAILLEKILRSKKESLNKISKTTPKRTFLKSPDKDKRETEQCYICNSIDEYIDGCMDILVTLYKKNDSFKENFNTSKGFCENHFYKIIDKCDENSEQVLKEKSILIQKENFARMRDETEWFVDKMNYLNHDKPWKNSKDAIPRAIIKLSGNIIKK